MNRCPSRHCAKCGKRGHSAKTCLSKQRVFQVRESSNQSAGDHAVTLGVSLDNARASAMLDSGASMSVMDEGLVSELDLSGKVQFANDLDTVGYWSSWTVGGGRIVD